VKNRRNRFAFDSLENRFSPAVITYPLASSIIIFDPPGDREPEPRPYGTSVICEPVMVPKIRFIQVDDPGLDTSTIA
jgi:hypothetical protein